MKINKYGIPLQIEDEEFILSIFNDASDFITLKFLEYKIKPQPNISPKVFNLLKPVEKLKNQRKATEKIIRIIYDVR